MAKHVRFITSSLSAILTETAMASRGIAQGIESFAICDYVFQTMFLKMTGALEQKMKCICWELATDDFDFRHVYLFNLGKYGEMSTYESKNLVYENLVEIIRKQDKTFDPKNSIDHVTALSETKQSVLDAFRNNPISLWNQRHYDMFVTLFDGIKEQQFADKKLFDSVLQALYENLYRHRNRCAHNAFSYQQNLPTLRQLADANYKYENYYFRFGLLLLIDNVFIQLFNVYNKGC